MTQTTTLGEQDRTRFVRRIMLLLGVFFVLVQINRSAGGVLANYLSSTSGMSAADIGTVMGTMFFAAAAVQMPTGILFDWLGPRRTLCYMSAIAVVGIVIFALADGVLGMTIGRFAIGAGHGGIITAIFLVAMAWASPEQVTTFTATVVGVAGAIGGMLATAPLAYALEAFGLAASFLLIAGLTGLATVALYVGLPDEQARAEPDPGAPAETFAEPPRETLGQTISGLMVVLRMPELRRLYAMGFCFAAPFMAIGGLWAGPYFTEVHGLAPGDAALVLASLVLALHLGTYFYGPLERRMRSRKKLILTGVAIQIAMLGIVAAFPGAPVPLAVTALFVFSCAAPFYVVLAAHTHMFVPKRRLGRAMTCINLAGLTGIFVMQAGTGALIELVQSMGGSAETGHRLVFVSVIVVLSVSAAVYRGQPEAPEAPPET